MDKMRDEFEKWYEKNKSKPFSTVSIKERMFDSWKGRHETLIVELPDAQCPCDIMEDTEVYYASDVHAMFEAAGIKVVKNDSHVC